MNIYVVIELFNPSYTVRLDVVQGTQHRNEEICSYVFLFLILREGKNENCARIVSEAVCFGQLVSILSRQRTAHIFRRTLCR